jgi:hypothetical protein
MIRPTHLASTNGYYVQADSVQGAGRPAGPIGPSGQLAQLDPSDRPAPGGARTSFSGHSLF